MLGGGSARARAITGDACEELNVVTEINGISKTSIANAISRIRFVGNAVQRTPHRAYFSIVARIPTRILFHLNLQRYLYDFTQRGA